MKFQQRTNAAAFSHAFVLTIRTFPSSEHSLFDLKYPIVKEADAGSTFKDLNASLDTDEKMISPVISDTDKVSSSKAAICQSKKVDQISKYNAIEDMLNKALETTINTNFQDDVKDSAIFRENLDERIGSGTTTAEMHMADKRNTEFHNNLQENISINRNIERYEKNVEQCSIDCVQEQSLSMKKTDEIEKAHEKKEEKETELIIIQKQDQHIHFQKDKISLSLKPHTETTKDGVNNWLLSDNLNFDEKSIEKDDICIIDNKDSLDDKEMTSENVIDINNVPMYQYSIKKETEDAKPNSIIDQLEQKTLQTEIKGINKDCVPKMIGENNKCVYTKEKEIYNEMIESQENDRQHIKISTNVDDKQSEDNIHSKSYKSRKKSRDSERKTIPDKVLRSSNITDLVMEGLMFTIRQDQDSIAVIEQKTKLEVDEVLENSEKVETKAGEKCLLNSSLLRLENLVTMIDSPRNRDEHKNRLAISNGTNLPPFNAFPSDTVHNININYVDADMDKSSVSNYYRYNAMNYLNQYQSQWQHQCVPSNITNNNDSHSARTSTEKCEQSMEWQDGDTKQDKTYNNDAAMRTQEDIPEISTFKKINARLRDTNSLMIRNIEEIDKRDKSTKEHNSPLSYSLLNPSRMSAETISKESSLIKLSRQEANVPRIISDKSISIEQMSPALRKVLRHTCRTRRFSSTISSGTTVLQRNEQKMQHMAGDAISEADVLLRNKCMDPNTNNSSIKCTIDPEKIKSDNEKSCITIEKDVPETNRDTRVKNSKEKVETRCTLRRSSSSKHSPPRKLQDITEDFYYDLLHVHNKDNAIRQRCLRQKQRSLNNLDDIKSGKVRIEMLKFIQDITEGARVVVRRLNIDNKPNLLEKQSNLI